MTPEMTPEEIKHYEERIDAKYDWLVEQSTKPGNMEATQRLINEFYSEEKIEVSGTWHRARGMREVRALDPKNERHQLWLQDYIRVLHRADVVQDIPGLLTDDLKKDVNKYKELSGCEIFVLPNGDLIYLDNPIVHSVVEIDGTMRLHREDGPAILFADGSCLYALDDIKVPQWVVETAAADMDPAAVLAIVDVDARMIALRKMGVARLLAGREPIARDASYAIYDLADVLDSDEPCLYLDMINPTSGEHHVEGLDSTCTTIADALAWRAGGREWTPCQIDATRYLDGNPDQYQQGDVLIERADVIPDDAPIVEGRELLAAGQRRHVAVGNLTLRGDDTRQWVDAQAGWAIEHPEHGRIDLPAGCWEVWGVVEIDHITGVLRRVVD